MDDLMSFCTNHDERAKGIENILRIVLGKDVTGLVVDLLEDELNPIDLDEILRELIISKFVIETEHRYRRNLGIRQFIAL